MSVYMLSQNKRKKKGQREKDGVRQESSKRESKDECKSDQSIKPSFLWVEDLSVQQMKYGLIVCLWTNGCLDL